MTEHGCRAETTPARETDLATDVPACVTVMIALSLQVWRRSQDMTFRPDSNSEKQAAEGGLRFIALGKVSCSCLMRALRFCQNIFPSGLIAKDVRALIES